MFNFFNLLIWYGKKERLIENFIDMGRNKIFAALHAGSLETIFRGGFPSALECRDVLFYPDGISVVLIMRRWGARKVERIPTTDVGWNFLNSLKLDERKIAIIGGDKVLNAQSKVIFQKNGFEVIWNFDGFEELNSPFERALTEPDCIIVGLGMPLELQYSLKLKRSYPNSRIFTCGGWLGFVTGNESRAPEIFQKLGGEWLWRLLLNPRRLTKRYVKAFNYFLLALVKKPSC